MIVYNFHFFSAALVPFEAHAPLSITVLAFAIVLQLFKAVSRRFQISEIIGCVENVELTQRYISERAPRLRAVTVLVKTLGLLVGITADCDVRLKSAKRPEADTTNRC